MGAFDGLRIPGGVPSYIDPDRKYIKQQSAFVLDKTFTLKMLRAKYVRDCRGKDYGHSWELCERAEGTIEDLKWKLFACEQRLKERDYWIDDDAKNLSDNEHEIRRLNERLAAAEAEIQKLRVYLKDAIERDWLNDEYPRDLWKKYSNAVKGG